MKKTNLMFNASVLALALCVSSISNAATLTITPFSNPDAAVNLTDLGTGDWALYSDTNLVPSERKVGGSGINALTFGTDDGATLTSSNSSQSIIYTWSDGTPTSSVANFDSDHLSTNNEPISASFSTSVLASTALNTLYVTYGQWNAVSRITASLSDGSVVDQFLDFDTNDHQTVQIDFESDAPSAVLNVEVVFLNDTGNTNSQLRFQSLALANSVDSIPEPSSVALLSLGGLALVLRRRK